MRVHYEQPVSPNPAMTALERHLLSDTLVVPLAPKQAMYNYNRISVRLARVIVEPIREVDDPQIRRRVERTRP